MEDLVGYDIEQAEAFLISQGYFVLVDDEPSDEFEEGEVIRSNPEAGAQLSEGQTIRLTISSGPKIRKEQMPEVVGLNVTTAVKKLNELGFNNIKKEFVISDALMDIVVEQSEKEGTLLDVTTQIVIRISAGPQETTEPSTEPDPTEESTQPSTDPEETLPDNGAVTVAWPIGLPTDKTEAYELEIKYNGGSATALRQLVEPNQTDITVQLTGTGVQVYEVYIDGTLYTQFSVNFSDYE
jgi:serine/threonine-protein kinase